MSNNTNTQITWRQIVKTIASKTGDDYQTKVHPRLKSGRNTLGSLIEVLGRKIQTDGR